MRPSTLLAALAFVHSCALAVPHEKRASIQPRTLLDIAIVRPDWPIVEGAKSGSISRRGITEKAEFLKEAAQEANVTPDSFVKAKGRKRGILQAHKIHPHAIFQTDKVVPPHELKVTRYELERIAAQPGSPASPVAVSHKGTLAGGLTQSETEAFSKAVQVHKKLFVPDMKGFVVSVARPSTAMRRTAVADITHDYSSSSTNSSHQLLRNRLCMP